MIPPEREAPEFDALLGRGGTLSRESFYEDRPGQVAMARAVWKALTSDEYLLVEAGTGTGKSLAYLLPSLGMDKRIVVSTRTKALQEQLAFKDIPLCAKILGREVNAVTVKGRANYLCRYYWDTFLKEPLLKSHREARYLKRLKAWAGETKTGDKSEWKGIPEDLALWRDVNARAERCLGSHCPLYQDCFVVKLRREAEAAEVVITNHHLLFADLALKRHWDAAALPEYGHLVLDEAHEAEDTATSFFGLSASRRMLQEWLHDTAKVFRTETDHPVIRSLQEATQAMQFFFGRFEGREGRTTFRADGIDEACRSLLARMNAALDAAALAVDSMKDPPEEAEGLLDRLEGWRQAMDFVTDGEDDAFVRWLEVSDRNVVFGASPVEVGPILQEHLYSRLRAAVFTSATLTVGGSFGYFRDRLGVPEAAVELRLQSPFDYGSQGVFYVPSKFPQPTSGDFLPALIEAVRALVGLSSGRAFVLCTSFRNMRAVAEALAGVPYPLLVQGDEPKGALLERFKAEGNAVLVATSSFWQGVDVQGEALSLVILDKIPFAVPSDPLVQARIERLKKAGRNAFSEYQVPSAAIILQQGAGRLIRSTRDRGVVACMDVRLRQKSYGRLLVRSLPSFRLTDRLEDVEKFFEEQ